MEKDISVKNYIKKQIIGDEGIRELMTNMSITTLPISKIFKITGPMKPEELYEYIKNPMNHGLLAEIGFRNNVNFQYPKVKSTNRGYIINDEEQLMGSGVEDIMYEQVLPSKVFYKKKTRN